MCVCVHLALTNTYGDDVGERAAAPLSSQLRQASASESARTELLDGILTTQMLSDDTLSDNVAVQVETRVNVRQRRPKRCKITDV